MSGNGTMIKKLQKAINMKFNANLLYSTGQFYSERTSRPVTVYFIKKSILGEDGKHTVVELYKSTSQIRIVLYLRDYWFLLNGWELPDDNEVWAEHRPSIEI